MAPTETTRERGSVMHPGDGIELRTACGHSFITCWTNRCFRLPPDLAAERDRLLAAAKTEHDKNLSAEDARHARVLRDIEEVYLRMARSREGQPALSAGTEVSFPAAPEHGYATRGRVVDIYASDLTLADVEFWAEDVKFTSQMQTRNLTPVKDTEAGQPS